MSLQRNMKGVTSCLDHECYDLACLHRILECKFMENGDVLTTLGCGELVGNPSRAMYYLTILIDDVRFLETRRDSTIQGFKRRRGLMLARTLVYIPGPQP